MAHYVYIHIYIYIISPTGIHTWVHKQRLYVYDMKIHRHISSTDAVTVPDKCIACHLIYIYIYIYHIAKDNIATCNIMCC